jgi:hypothetical protein
MRDAGGHMVQLISRFLGTSHLVYNILELLPSDVSSCSTMYRHESYETLPIVDGRITC